EGRDAKRDQKAREGRVLVLRHVEDMCFITEPAQRIDNIGRRLAIFPAYRHTARRQVDADIGNACNPAERLFDILDAQTTMNARNRQVELAKAVTERTTRHLHFICRNGLNDGRYLCILDAAAHNILPSFTRTRMMWRYGSSRPASAFTSMIHAPSPSSSGAVSMPGSRTVSVT